MTPRPAHTAHRRVSLQTSHIPVPLQTLHSYLTPDENLVPGLAYWYATVCRACPAGCGVHVRTREGRPVKLEGNPDHPVSRGALCARGQAFVQGLYGRTPTPIDPEVAKKVLKKGKDGRHEQYDCRPGDVLSPELDKVKEKSAAYAKTEEEQIMCALFPTTGKEFCEKRHGEE